MKDAWKGIAILGIWIGIGMVAMHAPIGVPVVALCGFLGTLVIASS